MVLLVYKLKNEAYTEKVWSDSFLTLCAWMGIFEERKGNIIETSITGKGFIKCMK